MITIIMQEKARWIKDLCRFLSLKSLYDLSRNIYYRQTHKIMVLLATAKIYILMICQIQLKLSIPVNKLLIKLYKLSASNIVEQELSNNIIVKKYDVLTIELT